MAFFEDGGDRLEGVVAKMPTDADTSNARTLYNALNAKRRLTARPNLSKWANEFRLLRTARTEEEITPALDWYCEHIGHQYIPDCRSAESFRKKFPAIEDAMQRGGLALPTEISETAKTIAAELGNLQWPGGDADKQQELAFHQANLDIWTNFRAQLLRAKKEAAGTRAAGFYENMWLMMSCPKTFAMGWANDVHRWAWDLHRRGRWQPGTLHRHIIKFSHWRIREFLEVECRDWGGGYTVDDILKATGCT